MAEELDGAAGELVAKINEIDPKIFNIEYDDLEGMREVAGGNFGEIFKGSWFGAEVAVKRLLDVDDSDMHKYIEREMAVLSEMRHPNVVQLLGLCKHSSGVYIVTEWVPGGDLRQILKDKSRDLSWVLRVKMASDVANAMAFLHARGCIHRDLKSNNLLVGTNWRIKVCDFGFARATNSEEFMTLCGTDQWMAPEVMLGDKYNEKADVFSFAMVLTEIVRRKKPVARLPGRAFAFSTDTFKKDVPSDCPSELVNLTIQAAEFYPEKRPSFRDILARLKALLAQMQSDPDSVPTGAGSYEPSSEPVPKPKPKRPTLQMRALKDYTGKDEDELSFKTGDVIVAVAKDDTGWIKGLLEGREGWFPAEAVEIV